MRAVAFAWSHSVAATFYVSQKAARIERSLQPTTNSIQFNSSSLSTFISLSFLVFSSQNPKSTPNELIFRQKLLTLLHCFHAKHSKLNLRNFVNALFSRFYLLQSSESNLIQREITNGK